MPHWVSKTSNFVKPKQLLCFTATLSGKSLTFCREFVNARKGKGISKGFAANVLHKKIKTSFGAFVSDSGPSQCVDPWGHGSHPGQPGGAAETDALPAVRRVAATELRGAAQHAQLASVPAGTNIVLRSGIKTVSLARFCSPLTFVFGFCVCSGYEHVQQRSGVRPVGASDEPVWSPSWGCRCCQ